jgi:hypothetical protein
MSTSRLGAAAAGALLLAAVLAGCGGDDGGPRLSRAAFTDKANKECQTLKQASQEFHDAQKPSAAGKQVSGMLRKVADRLRQLVRNVDRLVPPNAIQGEVDTLLGVLASYADGLDTLASRTGADETFQNVLDANVKTVNRLNDLATRAGQLVVNLGLTACVLPA